MLKLCLLPGRRAPLASIPSSGKQSGSESVRRPDDTGTLDFTFLAANPPQSGAAAKPLPAQAQAQASMQPAIEEAAILHADGRSKEAKERLLKAIRHEQPGAAAERMWLMLFDLHQALGEKREFEARSLEFALKFKRTAPVWRGDDGSSASAMLQTGSGAFISLTGKLSADSAPQMVKMRALAEKNRLLRLDFSRLQGADGPGCRLLLELLQSVRRRGGEAMFTGDAVFLGALAKATKAGAREVDPTLWLLRLEILQWQGRQKEFDDLALDYAVTYEVSPPSFEPSVAPAAAARKASTEPGDGTLKAPRQFADSESAFLAQIEEAAHARRLVSLDLADTQRMDFATAGRLLNLATNLHAHDKRLEIRNANALVAALLEVVGASEFLAAVARR